MNLIFTLVLLVIGMILIIKGGDLFVNSAVWIAEKTGIPQLIIGATIVSGGTTLPELLVTLMAAISGMQNPEQAVSYNEIAVNNAIGSMLCNIGLILAIVLTFTVVKTEGKTYSEKAVFVLGATVLLSVFMLTGGEITVFEGIILLLIFILFIYINIHDAQRQIRAEPIKDNETKNETGETKKENRSSVKIIALFIVGAASIAIGARLLVDNGVDLAAWLGIPAQIVGVTVIAVGTSLPELVTAVTSLKKGTAHLSVGNIFGANILNATLLLGTASVVTRQGMPIDTITKSVSIWILLAITFIAVVPGIFNKKTKQWQGLAVLCLYVLFVAVNVILVLNLI